MKKSKVHNIDIQKEVNPHFKTVWTSKRPYNILKGGRNSFKSSVIALLLVYKMVQMVNRGEHANVVVIRKVANSLRDSVYLKIQWALEKFGIADDFEGTVSPLRLRHKRTGSTFYFYGSDDFQKLKSNDIGDIIAVWYEEAAEFKNAEEFDQVNVTFMRQKHRLVDVVQFYWSYNPPRNPYSWINEWAESLKGVSEYLVHESSYLNDVLGFVTDQMLAGIKRTKENDYDYYRYLYLGEPVGLGTNVYNIDLFQPLQSLPDDDKIIELFYAMDSGHSTSATTCGAYALTAKGKVILLNTLYYDPRAQARKKAPDEQADMIYDFVKTTSNQPELRAPIRNMTMDSADGALFNQLKKSYNMTWSRVAKKKKMVMIDYVHMLLAQGRFYYLEKPIPTGLPNADSNDIFIEEHKKYMFDEKTLDKEDVKVIGVDDHTADAFQYFVLDNAKRLGVRL